MVTFVIDDSSFSAALIPLGLDVKTRSIQEEDSLVIEVGWLIYWLWLAEEVRNLISHRLLISLSKAHRWGDLELTSLVIIEHAGLRSLIFDKKKLRSVQESSNSPDVCLGDLNKHVKKYFFFLNSQLSNKIFIKLTQIIYLYNRKMVLVINTNTSSLYVTRMISTDIHDQDGYFLIIIFN